MGKVSPRDKESKTRKQRRHIRSSSNKHLKPGALAQLRHIKASATNSCKHLGMESIAQLNAKKGESVTMLDDKVVHGSSMFLPETFESLVDSVDLPKQHNLFKMPKTSDAADCISQSRLESLPIDLLVIGFISIDISLFYWKTTICIYSEKVHYPLRWVLLLFLSI